MSFASNPYRCVFAMLMPLLMAALLAISASAETHHKLAVDFENRANQYLDLRQKVAGKATKPSDSPEAITSSQRDLGDKLRVARAGAKQGEIFTPAISRYFRHELAESLDGKKGQEIRRSLRSAEPVTIELQVNTSYPDNVPLQSTPAGLLRRLPQLPKGLEYRILNRELVLRDTEANFVVDYIPNALPDLKK